MEEKEEVKDEVLAKAEKMGWVPMDQWKGDPTQWKPAEEFVERGENIIPILKDRISKLEKEIEITTRINHDEIEAVKKLTYEKAKSEYEEKLKRLQLDEFEAFKSGDVEKYQQVKKDMQEIKPPVLFQANTRQRFDNPVFEDWKKKNAWYQEDNELQEYADFVGSRIANDNLESGMLRIPLDKLYEQVEQRVKKQFAHKFQNPNRDRAAAVEGDSPFSGKRGENSFESLPSSAKSQYKRMSSNFERQGRKLTKEDYAKYYYEQG